MEFVSKLLLAPMAAVLAVSFTGSASATKPWPPGMQTPVPVAEEGQTPPPRAPRQFFPEKRVQPLTPEIEQSLIPKDSFKECDVCPEMVVVPKGSFMMGTPADEPDRFKGEDPIHRVSFAKPFAVGRFTISFDEWDACLADGGCGRDKGDDKGFGRGRMPAQGINFVAAKSYLAWLSKKVGRTYRLPSESEREYFTRAGTSTTFWFGNTISAQDANYKASIPYGAGPRGADSKGPWWWTPIRPTRSACIRCTATCSSGPRTASTSATMKIRRSMAHPGSRAIASGACYAAAPGTGSPTWFARAIAKTASSTAAATVFAWCAC
ncbi:formylglycine-generating enzyme family protein [Bradyrhizobium sp. AUGA SZCCT0182]|nr:formylglycine-generating enzyme family protein [Bradyrhizobium sp. AUGA SZCCT0182]MBR1237834.1 formylglycine-generating enzyme family protein [Bradyrhizobium sp. AUGA SZCCT0182]